ncbi:hypothetical protein BE21_55495 [Sorangium cellulosum]|uniref:Uncharacterized protein n=1 Tax=Sorangium cellulosum TaxID=56 RepID=A0A150TBS7_SORCE|nr:hypothetical protein BE21_55495 [Sorangium cellulosum]
MTGFTARLLDAHHPRTAGEQVVLALAERARADRQTEPRPGGEREQRPEERDRADERERLVEAL